MLHYGDLSTVNEQIQADRFAKFFSTNFEPWHQNNIYQQHTIEGSNDIFVLEVLFIFDELMKIDTSKGTGPDGIHPLVLQNCAAHFCSPLALIFNESSTLGLFPNQ